MNDSKFILKKIIQTILFVIIFGLICAVFSKIDSKEKYINILEMVFLCLYMVIGSVYIIKDFVSKDRIRGKEIKTEKKELKKFNEYLDILNNFNYNHSNLEDKTKLLIASLYESSVTYQMVDFYARTRDFTRAEIKDILYNKIDYEFDEFIDDVIMNFKESMSIAFFKTRIINVINKEIGCDMDNKYYYDMTYNFRASIVESSNKYNVVKESFKDGRWQVIQIEKGYQTDDSAYLEITKLVNVINDELRNNLNAELKKTNVDEHMFKLYAHTYKVMYDSSTPEACLFRLYYIIRNYGLKQYIKCLKTDKKDIKIMIESFPNLKEELIVISTKHLSDKRIEFIKNVLIEKIEPYIDDYIKDDKYNIEK